MSATTEPEFDLEQLFLPAWAKQAPDVNRYARFEGETGARADSPGRNRGLGHPRRDRPPRRDTAPPAGAGDRFRSPRGDRRPPARRDADRPELRREPEPLPQVEATLVPEEKGVESLARQIRLTGRAYPLFEIAGLILKKSDRFQIRFSVVKKPDGQPAQALFFCSLDESLWLSEAEAADHVLRKHFDTFYRTEKVAIDPPKGTYTFVAQCGMSGEVLGPPNYHDYQAKLRKLHAERFARMPFEAFKARVRIVKDEAVVKQWLEAQSWKLEYVALNVPEALKLPTRDAVEKHFRDTHLANLVRPVDGHGLSGVALAGLSPGLRRLVHRTVDEQRRFPLKVVHVLSQQFARHGLQFFKVNKTVTYVAVARPHYLDLDATPVSEGVKRIIGFINATPKCTRRRLLAALAPAGAPPPAGDSAEPGPAEAPPAPSAPATQDTPAAPSPAQPQAPPPDAVSPVTDAIHADLHWLIHEGHVIEFANGILETAKAPPPRPPKPPPPPAAPSPSPAAVVDTLASPTPAPAPAEPANPWVEPVAETGPASPAPPAAIDLGGPVPEVATESEETPVTEPVADLSQPGPPPGT